MESIRQIRGLSQAESELVLAGNDRLLAKRDARERLKAEGKLDGRGDIPIRTAGELLEELMPTIRIALDRAVDEALMRKRGRLRQ